MQTIPIHGGLVALVDDEDYDLLCQYTWHFSSRYVRTNIRVNLPGRRQTTVAMHRLLLNPPEGMEVDHINGNTLDNRRANLRLCTHAENSRNRRRRRDNQSGAKGVTPCPSGWRATINVGGKNVHLGCFATVDDAAQAYNEAATRYHGKFVRTNHE